MVTTRRSARKKKKAYKPVIIESSESEDDNIYNYETEEEEVIEHKKEEESNMNKQFYMPKNLLIFILIPSIYMIISFFTSDVLNTMFQSSILYDDSNNDFDNLKQYFLDIQQQQTNQLKQELLIYIDKQMNDIKRSIEVDNLNLSPSSSASSISYDHIENKDLITKSYLENRLKKYNADQTGKIDYSLASSGGKIIASSLSAIVIKDNAKKSILSNLLHQKSSNSHEIMLMSTMEVGNCWPMKGSQGYVIIQLREEIFIESISYEHVSKLISPTVSSAPNDIYIYGLKDKPTNYKKDSTLAIPTNKADFLLSFNYDLDDVNTIQEHQILKNNLKRSYQYILIEIKTNHGHELTTCLYRWRVHGNRLH